MEFLVAGIVEQSFRNADTDGIAHLFRLFCEIFVVEIGDQTDGNQQIEDVVHGAAIGAEQACHFLFMGTFGTGGVPGSDPAGGVIDREDQPQTDAEQIEVTQF